MLLLSRRALLIKDLIMAAKGLDENNKPTFYRKQFMIKV
jgi:hypothetical protein